MISLIGSQKSRIEGVISASTTAPTIKINSIGAICNLQYSKNCRTTKALSKFILLYVYYMFICLFY